MMKSRDNFLPAHVSDVAIDAVVSDVASFRLELSRYDDVLPWKLEDELNDIDDDEVTLIAKNLHNVEIYCKKTVVI